MIPKRLRISGFLSYRQASELDFDHFTLACISGSNGAGKSSLLDAITWALFGRARRSDDAVINSHSTQAEVVFDFEYEQALYCVQRLKERNKLTMLEFSIFDDNGRWRPLTESGVRETERRIQQTLAMDYETFTNASFFLQGKADQFAQQRPNERKRILSSVLGLEVWEEYKNRAAEQRKTQENALSALDGQIAEINTELGEEDQRKQALEALQKDLAQFIQSREQRENALEHHKRMAAAVQEQNKLVELFHSQAQSIRQRVDGLQADLQARGAGLAQAQQRLESAGEVQASFQAWQENRRLLEAWESKAERYRAIESRRAPLITEIEKETARLENEIEGLEATRRQVGAQEAELPALMEQIRQVETSIQQSEAALRQRDTLQTQLEDLNRRQVETQAENRRLKEAMQELRERIDRLQAASEAAGCPLCGQPLSAAHRGDLVNRLSAEGQALKDQYLRNEAAQQTEKEQRSQLEQQIRQLQQTEKTLAAAQRQFDQLTHRKESIEKTLQDWQAGGAVRLQEAAAKLQNQSFAESARSSLAALQVEMDAVQYDPQAHRGVKQAELAGRASEEAMRQLDAARAAIEPMQREIQNLTRQLDAASQELSAAEQQHQQAQQNYLERAKDLPDLSRLEKELFQVREQENRLRMQVGSARQRVDVLAGLKKRLQDLTAQREETAQEIGRLKQLELAFGKNGVPALLIEQALPEIQNEANDILEKLTNGSMSVIFETQRDYKDKKREDKKETLDIIINDESGVNRDYEMFSGGEAFRINFAIRLALSRFLSHRAGARLQTLVIDEGFGSQDAEGRQRLIEAINLVREDFAKILVITHLEELKDAFPARIEVEKTPQGSLMKVVT
ncbi:MAG: SMC family ATPase [Chloroflexi bacterium]|nr:SMC family ATPase [Chloroflexota bacterium]